MTAPLTIDREAPAAAGGEERLVDFQAVVRVVALGQGGIVYSVDPAQPRQLTEKSQKLGSYETRPFGKQFQVITDIYRTAWTTLLDKNPADLHQNQVMPAFLRPMAVNAP